MWCAGVKSNERWLALVLRSARFLEVRHHIALLDTSVGDFAGPQTLPPEALILAALALHQQGLRPRRADPAAPISPWEARDGFTPNLPALVAYRFLWHGTTHGVELHYAEGAAAAAVVGTQRSPLAAVSVDDESVAARIDVRRRQARYLVSGERVHLWLGSEHYELQLDDPRTHEFTASAASGGLTTPLPGVVVSVPVAVGQQVEAGAVLMVIEAMKMEHTISAPYAGAVEAIHFARGDRVPEGSELLTLTRTPQTTPQIGRG
jgi:3-methylcrotonyl-CoA carboxylase alpha subunit